MACARSPGGLGRPAVAPQASRGKRRSLPSPKPCSCHRCLLTPHVGPVTFCSRGYARGYTGLPLLRTGPSSGPQANVHGHPDDDAAPQKGRKRNPSYQLHYQAMQHGPRCKAGAHLVKIPLRGQPVFFSRPAETWQLYVDGHGRRGQRQASSRASSHQAQQAKPLRRALPGAGWAGLWRDSGLYQSYRGRAGRADCGRACSRWQDSRA